VSRNRSGSHGGSGGTGCGWLLGLVAMVAAVGSLYVSVSVGAGSLTNGAVGMPAESHNMAGLLLVVAIVVLKMARREER